MMMMMIMMMMVFCPETGTLAFYATWRWDEKWFPVAFLTDNYGWATCPRSLRSGL